VTSTAAELIGLGGGVKYKSTKTFGQYILFDAGRQVTITRLVVTLSASANSVHQLELRTSSTGLDINTFTTVTDGTFVLQQSTLQQNFYQFHTKSRYWCLYLADNFGGSTGIEFENVTLYAPEAPWSPCK
jgi:hypothetical protein